MLLTFFPGYTVSRLKFGSFRLSFYLISTTFFAFFSPIFVFVTRNELSEKPWEHSHVRTAMTRTFTSRTAMPEQLQPGQIWPEEPQPGEPWPAEPWQG